MAASRNTSPNDVLKRELFSSVGEALARYAFRVNVKKDSFLRAHDGVVEIFQLVCLDGKPGLRVQPNVAVRINLVEDIFHQTTGFEPKYQKDTPTIGGAIGNLVANDNCAAEFLLESSDQVPEISRQIVDTFLDLALKYYERFTQLTEIDKEQNENLLDRTPNRAASWLRASSGIIVAKLLHRETTMIWSLLILNF